MFGPLFSEPIGGNIFTPPIQSQDGAEESYLLLADGFFLLLGDGSGFIII